MGAFTILKFPLLEMVDMEIFMRLEIIYSRKWQLVPFFLIDSAACPTLMASRGR